MSGLPWYKCFPRDFNEGMLGLTLEERGAYITILNVIYSRGGPIPDDSSYFRALLCCSPRTWLKLRASLIKRHKLFEVNFNGEPSLMNRRAAEEISKRGEVSEIRAAAGSEGGRKSTAKTREINELGQANGEQTPSKTQAIQITDTEGSEEANASLSSADDAPVPPKYPEPFEAIWKAYPHVKGRSSKPKAFAVWRRLPVAVRTSLPPAIARYAREGREPKAECGAPAMERWLKDGRYEDWLARPDSRPAPKAEPAIYAAHVRHFRDTGEWNPAWGPRPNLETAA